MGLIRFRDTLQRWLDTKVKYSDNGPRRWNYDDLADALNVSSSLIEKVMSGHANVTTRLLIKLCDYTHYDIGELVTYDPKATAKEDDEKDE